MYIGGGVTGLKGWNKDQTTRARSSGEAELYAANLGGSQALGVQSIMREAGRNLEINIASRCQCNNWNPAPKRPRQAPTHRGGSTVVTR